MTARPMTREDRVAAGGAQRRSVSPLHRWLGHSTRRAASVAGALVLVWLAFVLSPKLVLSRLRSAQEARTRLMVEAPRCVPVGAAIDFTVVTADGTGRPASASVRWRALAADGHELLAGSADVDGVRQLTLPGSSQAPASIEVEATRGGVAVRAEVELAVEHILPLIHVTSDRPVYRPGEVALLRAVALNRVTLAPVPFDRRRMHGETSWFEVRDARGSVAGKLVVGDGVDWSEEKLLSALAEVGVCSGAWRIPGGRAAGVYTIQLVTDQGPISRPIQVVVRDVQPPRLAKRVSLEHPTYAPGATGVAEVTVERLGTSDQDGGPAAGARVEASVVVDGQQVWSETAPVDALGRARFRFRVPEQVTRGDARLVARVSDGAVVETEVKPFVVPTGKVEVTLCPEGGELIACWPCRVYAEVMDPLGRPVAARGRVVDDTGAAVCDFATGHQGRARFELLPEPGRRYVLELTEPTRGTFALPAVRAEGVALRLRTDAVPPGASIPLRIASRAAEPLVAVASCRGIVVGRTAVAGGGSRDVDLAVPDHVHGVLRVTVFDAHHRPLAERLVQRQSAQRVSVEILPENKTLPPGGRQELTLRARDESGKPVANAWLGISVTDRALEELGVAPRIGLADHVSLFEDAEVGEDLEAFFAGAGGSPLATDLLLGTRGWRRFVWRGDEPSRSTLAARGLDAGLELWREGHSWQREMTWGDYPDDHGHENSVVENIVRAEHFALDVVPVLLGLFLLIEGIAAQVRVFRQCSRNRVADLLLAQLPVALVATVLAFAIHATTCAHESTRYPYRDWDRECEIMVELGIPWEQMKGPPPPPPPADIAAFWAKVEEQTGASRRRGGPVAAADDTTQGGESTDSADPNGSGPIAGGGREGWIREYVHRRQPRADSTDFAATVFWNPLVTTDDTGSAHLAFDVSDRVTTWLVAVDAHACTHGIGRVGTTRATFVTTKPFHLEAKLPCEVSQGDELRLPVAVEARGLAVARIAAHLHSEGLQAASRPALTAEMPLTDGRGRAFVPLSVAASDGPIRLSLTGSAGRFTDTITQALRVVPRGFPHARSLGGVMEPTATLEVPMPRECVGGPARVTLKVFPSPLSLLHEGLAGIVQEPHGCFEQASSANYPNVLVLGFLAATGEDVASVAAPARARLARGYRLIAGYECKSGGFEWFGKDPGHPALTAYGILQFQDMARVFAVDRALVERTRQWLLGRRDGEGGFAADREHHRFGAASADVGNAWLTYALLYSGEKPESLAREIDRVAMRVQASRDPYEIALATCALAEARRPEAATGRARLRAVQDAGGSLTGATTSITSSRGRDLTVETTSFGVLAWLPDPSFAGDVEQAMRFLRGCQKAGGTFGATQATIQALRALTAHATAHRRMPAAGTVRARLGERVIAQRSFGRGQRDAIALDLGPGLLPGANHLTLELVDGGGRLPFALDVAYHAEQPADDPDGTVAIATRVAAPTVPEGRTVAVTATVTNRTGEGLPMTLAVVGLPAGLEAPTAVLEDLKQSGAIDFWELMGRDVVLYWRGLKPHESREVTLDCVARIPGRSTGAASRAYLYYTPSARRWAAPLAVTVEG